MTRSRTLLAWLLVAPLAGCVARLDYAADATLLDEVRREDAAHELARLLERSRDPLITVAEVAPDAYRYSWVHWVPIEKRVAFANAESLEVFENGVVRVRAPNRVMLDQVRFHTVDEAKRFLDLVASFRAKARGEHAEWPRAAAPPVETLAQAEARDELTRLLRRAIEPRILSVEVGDDGYAFEYRRSVVGLPARLVIQYQEVARVESSSSQRVELYDARGRRLDRMRFGTAEEAVRFRALVLHLRDLEGERPDPHDVLPPVPARRPPEPANAGAPHDARETRSVLDELDPTQPPEVVLGEALWQVSQPVILEVEATARSYRYEFQPDSGAPTASREVPLGDVARVIVLPDGRVEVRARGGALLDRLRFPRVEEAETFRRAVEALARR